MSEAASGPSGPTSSVPPSAYTPNQRRQAPPATGTQESRSARQIRTIWMAVGAVIITAVLFGIGFAAGHVGTSSADLEQNAVSVISNVDPSVVQVQGRGSGAGGGSVGSGEILTSSGYIVTNDHVVRGFASYTALLASGQTVQAQLVGEVPQEDLAVLKIAASNLKPIVVGDSSKVQVGEYAIAMGSPLGLEQSATSGIVSALDRQGNEVVDGKTFTLTGMIQTSAPINPGNSGGALVNINGELIGIPTLSAVDPSTRVAANGIGFAIASNRMKTIVAPFIPAGS
ncbi:MAG: S1C family serine protease [Ktedonobacterales bacterium]